MPQVAIYTQPPGTPLVPSPLYFGAPGDSPDASALPAPFMRNVDTQVGKTDYKAKYYETEYVKQVGANWAEVGLGANDNDSIKYLGQGGPFNTSARTLHYANLGNGPNTTPQFNLLQPIPYWNVQIVTPQQLAAYDSVYGTLQTQVPAEYVAAGTPNLYLGK